MNHTLIDIILFPRNFTIESDSSIWWDICINLLSTIGGFAIAWFFFERQRRSERQDESDRLNEVAIYTNAKLNELIGGMNDQVTEIQKLCKGLKRNRDIDYYFSIALKFSTTNLSIISRVDLYRICVTNGRGSYNENMDKYNRLLNIIDSVTEYKFLLPNSFRNYIDRKEKHTEQWSEAITELHKAFDTLSANIRMQKKNPANTPILIEFYKLKYNWSQKKRPKADNNFRDMYITYNEFILPLYNYTKAHAKDPRSQIYMNYILECLSAYNNIIYIKHFYRRNFILDARKIIGQRNKLFGLLQEDVIRTNLQQIIH